MADTRSREKRTEDVPVEIEAARAMQVGREGDGRGRAAVRNKAPSGNRHNTGLQPGRRAIPSQIWPGTHRALCQTNGKGLR
ncbi:unnamed protein product [Leptosia nina]|uniref:Uncharacterized protein n=1 Tax=Leptosia nina TaxID=320188 RepID=A0AAV1JG54_9NEOP